MYKLLAILLLQHRSHHVRGIPTGDYEPIANQYRPPIFEPEVPAIMPVCDNEFTEFAQDGVVAV